MHSALERFLDTEIICIPKAFAACLLFNHPFISALSTDNYGQHRWERSSNAVLLEHSALDIQVNCIHMHEHIDCSSCSFASWAMFVVSLWTKLVDRVEKDRGFYFFLAHCYPQEKFTVTRQLKLTKTIKQLHSCDVLSFLLLLFAYSQIHKVQQLVVGYQVIH